MKFNKPFKGVCDGDVYPTSFGEGDDCPKELLDAAIAAGAVKKQTKAEKGAPEKK